MSKAVSAELRAAIARAGYNVQQFAALSGLPVSTLHKTLKGQRAVDVEDVLTICDTLGILPGELVETAAGYARQNMANEPSAQLTEAVAKHLAEVSSSTNVGGSGHDAHITQLVDYRENRELEIGAGTESDVRDALADRHAALKDNDPSAEQESPDTP